MTTGITAVYQSALLLPIHATVRVSVDYEPIASAGPALYDVPMADSRSQIEFDLLQRLADHSGELRTCGDWPREPFRWLAERGVLGWVIPEPLGGTDVSPLQLIEGYDRLAAACLVTTFILTQRNGACQRIAAADDNDWLGPELLPPLAAGDLFATVGISHLSTSRQHLRRPAVAIEDSGNEYILQGEIPWVTGAPHADIVVTGGTCHDGRQMLIALPCDAQGVSCGPAADLLALSASCTASLTLENVHVPRRYRIAGPVEAVMRRGSGGGTGSVATSALAVGLSERVVRLLEQETESRPELSSVSAPLRRELVQLRRDLYSAADSDPLVAGPCSPETLRQRSNSLVLRSTQAALAASKGAGFVCGHPAERSVREALFFLVWSCPQPVVAHALRQFACPSEI